MPGLGSSANFGRYLLNSILFTYNIHQSLLSLFSFTVSNYLQNFRKTLEADKENKAYKLSDRNFGKNTTLWDKQFFFKIFTNASFIYSQCPIALQSIKKALEQIMGAKHTNSDCGNDDTFWGYQDFLQDIYYSYFCLLIIYYHMVKIPKNSLAWVSGNFFESIEYFHLCLLMVSHNYAKLKKKKIEMI